MEITIFVNILLGAVLVSAADLQTVDQLKDAKKKNEQRFLFQNEDSYDFRNIIVDTVRKLVYVGAVNYIFALDINDISVKKGEIRWAPDQRPMERCNIYQGNGVCQNSIRILHAVNSTFLYVCGTMAYNPMCTYIDKRSFKETQNHREKGKWRSPFDPSSSTVSTMIDGTLFAATSVILPANDGIISKTLNEAMLRSQEKDPFWLSDPQFVSAFNVPNDEGQGKVYILMRENAEEIPTQFLSQESEDVSKLVYSRVVSICINDHGGNSWVLNNNFATFTKMRIACPSASRSDKRTLPFYYDELQSTHQIPNPDDPTNPTIYAIFTTQSGAVDATATCVYNVHDIQRALDTNKYWNRPGTSNSLYTVYESSGDNVPGSCVEDTMELSDKRLRFSQEHPIKFGIIQPRDGSAIYQDVGQRYKHVVVDRVNLVEKMGNEEIKNEYDIVHYITEKGYIKRVVFSLKDRNEYWELPSRNFFGESDTKHSILNVKISNGNLYAGTNSSVIQIPCISCHEYDGCSECLTARDPYCAWMDSTKTCTKAIDMPTKQRIAYIKGLNTSVCDDDQLSGDQGPDKKSENTDGAFKSKLEKMKKEIVELQNLAMKQNETIHSMRLNKTSLRHILAKCVRDRGALIRNYTSLSSLILRYDASRKFAMQLYKNTVFSLHECQHKEALRRQYEDRNTALAAEKKASDEKSSINDTQFLLEECEKRGIETRAYLNTEPHKADTNCEDQKTAIEDKYDRLIKGLKAEIAATQKLRKSSKDSRLLAACVTKSTNLRNRASFLETKNRNLSRENRRLERVHRVDKRTNERLRWLHRRHGRRGSQTCEHDQWFVSETTKQMFHLSRDRPMQYDSAQKLCEERNGTLAILRDEDEIRYIHNLIRAFEPDRHFWIGLKKLNSQNIEWADGSSYSPGDTERFPASQVDELTDDKSYCAEINSHQRWGWVSCTKNRKALCKKEYTSEDQYLNNLLSEFDDYEGATESAKNI